MDVRHLIFDLDNTLYPATAEMDAGIHDRMMECVADFFGVSLEKAAEMKKINIQKFSTTLEWIRHEGFTDVEGFFAKVHPENEVDELKCDEALRPFLESIRIPKIILTNSPREHAERVLAKLNVSDLFDCICDIRDCKLLGKPYADAYRIALKMCDGTIDNTIFLDDMQKYTDGFAAMGGTAVLVGEKNGKPLSDEAAAELKGNGKQTGRTIKIKSVYELTKVLEEIRS